MPFLLATAFLVLQIIVYLMLLFAGSVPFEEAILVVDDPSQRGTVEGELNAQPAGRRTAIYPAILMNYTDSSGVLMDRLQDVLYCLETSGEPDSCIDESDMESAVQSAAQSIFPDEPQYTLRVSYRGATLTYDTGHDPQRARSAYAYSISLPGGTTGVIRMDIDSEVRTSMEWTQ